MSFEEARAYLEGLGVRVRRLDGFGLHLELPLPVGRWLRLEVWNGCPPSLGWVAVDSRDVDSAEAAVAEGGRAA